MIGAVIQHLKTRLAEDCLRCRSLFGMRHTSRRRSEPDPLAPVNEPTWLVVRQFRDPSEVTALEPMADLRKVLTAAREARMADGWSAEEIGRRCAFFYCSRGGQRVWVGIEKRDPMSPTLGHGPPPVRCG